MAERLGNSNSVTAIRSTIPACNEPSRCYFTYHPTDEFDSILPGKNVDLTHPLEVGHGNLPEFRFDDRCNDCSYRALLGPMIAEGISGHLNRHFECICDGVDVLVATTAQADQDDGVLGQRWGELRDVSDNVRRLKRGDYAFGATE